MADLQSLLNAIPTAQEGQIITAGYHNSLREALVQIANQLGGVPTSATPSITTGIVENTDFDERSILDGPFRIDSKLLTTLPINHGLGKVDVGLIIGLVGSEDRSRLKDAPELYYAALNTDVAKQNLQIIAAVTKPNNGFFRMIANRETLETFAGFRWWAIKA